MRLGWVWANAYKGIARANTVLDQLPKADRFGDPAKKPRHIDLYYPGEKQPASGVYEFDGGVSGGPPVRPLDRFYVRVRDGQVQVGPRYSVNSEFERFPSYRDPGQPLDGIGQYLYPGRFSTPKNP